MGTRQCPHCGEHVADNLSQCPNCREVMGPAPAAGFRGYRGTQGGPEIRKGLLWMLLASVIHYFADGHEPWLQIPVDIHPYVVEYLVPLLFLCGAGIVVLGIYRRLTS